MGNIANLMILNYATVFGKSTIAEVTYEGKSENKVPYFISTK
jgi:hypothetical protein